MSDEQRCMSFFQVQPEGPVLIFHPAALPLAYMEQPYVVRAALLDGK